MQRLFVAIVLIAYGAFAQEKQTVKDTSAGAHYGVEQQPPSYGYQQPPYQQPPMYQPQPSYFQPVPTFPQYALPNYDGRKFAQFSLIIIFLNFSLSSYKDILSSILLFTTSLFSFGRSRSRQGYVIFIYLFTVFLLVIYIYIYN
uniref:Uncharacterized protein n=1 Tax=Heterorhabditis bacteriophora TaxID=37862 RepID=A0A1I7XDQ0_HETBA